MREPRNLVECATPEKVNRALGQGHSITCSEEVAEHCGASFHNQGVDVFTLEEILASVFDPSVDGPPSRTIDYGQPRGLKPPSAREARGSSLPLPRGMAGLWSAAEIQTHFALFAGGALLGSLIDGFSDRQPCSGAARAVYGPGGPSAG